MANELLPQKSKFGTPCSGCGMCCGAEVCALGKIAFGDDAETPCPGLTYFNNRVWCKLILTEAMAGMGTDLADALGIGKGCCSDDF